MALEHHSGPFVPRGTGRVGTGVREARDTPRGDARMTTTTIMIAHTHHQRLKTSVYSRKRHDDASAVVPVPAVPAVGGGLTRNASGGNHRSFSVTYTFL